MPNALKSCPFCAKVFSYTADLNHHLTSHTKEKPHKCITCSASFGRLVYLKRHIKGVHEGVKAKTYPQERKWKCSLCTFKAFSRSGLDLHFQKHSTELQFSCNVPGCDFKTKYERSVQLHVQRMHSDERPHKCTSEGCNYKSNSSCNLRRHVKVHSKEKPFMCKREGCKLTFKYKSSLKSHVYVVHHEGKGFNCTICDFRTKNKSIFGQHKDEHKNAPRFHCEAPNCNFATKRKHQLQFHVGRKHTGKNIKCTAAGCNFRCGTSPVLKIHVKRRHVSEILKCPGAGGSCNFSARQLSELNLHVRIHHKDVQPDTLLVAGRSNLQKAGSANTLICTFPECDYQTEFQHRYDRHLKTHDEEKRKHKCTLCSYRCAKFQFLQIHIQRRHTGEKPYGCSLCNMTTACSTHLRLHAGKYHHVHVIPCRKGNQLVKVCRTCNRQFTSNSEFVLHSMTHLKAVVPLQRLTLHVL